MLSEIVIILFITICTYLFWLAGWQYYLIVGQNLVFWSQKLDGKPFNCLLCSQFWIMEGLNIILHWNIFKEFDNFYLIFVILLMPFPFSLLTMLRDKIKY